MYREEIGRAADLAVKKCALLQDSKLKYFLASCLAGVYVGLGILLIFTIGGLLVKDSLAVVRIVMGVSFGIALSLVLIAGSELFTGNNLVLTLGCLEKRTSGREFLLIHLISFGGNLLGAALLAILFVASGLTQGGAGEFIAKSAQAKMSLPWLQLVMRGILCNILVCLAIWCSFRLKEEIAKLVMIFWCLFAFITTGFEHSVANMTLLSVALLAPGTAAVSFSGFAYNIGLATLGNFIGGSLLAGAYWFISRRG